MISADHPVSISVTQIERPRRCVLRTRPIAAIRHCHTLDVTATSKERTAVGVPPRTLNPCLRRGRRWISRNSGPGLDKKIAGLSCGDQRESEDHD